jgi:hypothetical protein
VLVCEEAEAQETVPETTEAQVLAALTGNKTAFEQSSLTGAELVSKTEVELSDNELVVQTTTLR